MARTQLRRVALATVMLLGAGGCLVWTSLNGYSGGAPQGTEAGAPDGPEDVVMREAAAESALDGAPCAVALPPRPPAGMAPASLTLTFAVQSFYFRPQDAGIPDLGYNLDCVDTCPGPKSCRSVDQNCDEDGGRDLAGNALLEAIDGLGKDPGAQSIDGRIASGAFTFIIQMADWSSLPSDSQVAVGMLVSNGIDPDPEAGTFTPPTWNGSDPWTVDPRGVAGAFHDSTGWHYVPKALTVDAYVANNQLVGQLTAPIEFGLGAGEVTMSQVTLVASIVPVQLSSTVLGYRLEGQIAGRISVHSVLALAGEMKDPLDPTQYLCGNDPTFVQFRGSLCEQADIMTSPSEDNEGDVCDAVSVGIGFTAVSTILGPEYLGPPVVLGCDGGVVDCPADGG
jgi:hypothetical protein